MNAKLKKLFHSEKFRLVRKIVVIIAGSLVILAGVILLFIPGPAFVVIPAGFGILALEFSWARRWATAFIGWLRYLSKPKNLKRILYENSLSLVLFSLFAISMVGQILTGYSTYNSERTDHGAAPVKILSYLTSGHAIEATFENWESEFLQMGALVIFTVYLRQKGAPDSQSLRGGASLALKPNADSPWPVRRGGWALAIYKHSLSLALLGLFLLSFLLHAAGGRVRYNEEQFEHGGATLSTIGYMSTSRFWFESFQNWQSEFLSVGVLLVLSVFLRERGSPQSKRVEAPHWQTAGHQPAITSPLAPTTK